MVDELSRAANSRTPERVDEYTTLKRVYSDERDLVYIFEIAGNVPGYDRSEHRERLVKNFNIVICSTPRFREKLLKRGVRFIKMYVSSELELIDKFIFSEEQCFSDT